MGQAMKAMGAMLATVMLLSLGWPPSSRASGGLDVSVGDRSNNSTTFKKGERGDLVASVHFSEGGDCEARDLGPGATLTVTLTPPQGVDVEGSLSQTLTVPADLDELGEYDGPAMNASWPVEVSRAGSYDGSVRVSGTSTAGGRCTDSQRFHLVAVTSGPKLRVLGAFIYDTKVTVAVEVLLGQTLYDPEVYEDAIDLNHDSRYPTDAPVTRLLRPRFAGRSLGLLTDVGDTPLASALQVTTAEGVGVACLTYEAPSAIRSGDRLSYQLRFAGSTAKGFPSRTTRNATVTLKSRNRSAAEIACIRQNDGAFGNA